MKKKRQKKVLLHAQKMTRKKAASAGSAKNVKDNKI